MCFRTSFEGLVLRFQGRVNRLGRSDALRFQHLQAIYDNLNHINML